MLKLGSLILSSIIALSLIGCGSSTSAPATKEEPTKTAEQPKQEEKKETAAKTLSKDEFIQLYSDPVKFKGANVDFYAQIFMAPEKDEKGTYVQAWSDPKNNAHNTIVGIADPKLDVKQGDIIHVVGTVKDKFTGKNALGGEVTAPIIIADKVEKSDWGTAFAPAIKTIDVNQEQNQNGFIVKIAKVELAAEETRVYLSVTNQTKDKVNMFEHTAKILQGSNQLSVKNDFTNHYPKLQSDILPGVTTEGVITLPAIKPDSGPFKVVVEGMAYDFNTHLKPFMFDVN
jgi:hypothetical protein